MHEKCHPCRGTPPRFERQVPYPQHAFAVRRTDPLPPHASAVRRIRLLTSTRLRGSEDTPVAARLRGSKDRSPTPARLRGSKDTSPNLNTPPRFGGHPCRSWPPRFEGQIRYPQQPVMIRGVSYRIKKTERLTAGEGVRDWIATPLAGFHPTADVASLRS